MTIILYSVTQDLLPDLSGLQSSHLSKGSKIALLTTLKSGRRDRDKEFEKHQRPYM